MFVTGRGEELLLLEGVVERRGGAYGPRVGRQGKRRRRTRGVSPARLRPGCVHSLLSRSIMAGQPDRQAVKHIPHNNTHALAPDGREAGDGVGGRPGGAGRRWSQHLARDGDDAASWLNAWQAQAGRLRCTTYITHLSGAGRACGWVLTFDSMTYDDVFHPS